MAQAQVTGVELSEKETVGKEGSGDDSCLLSDSEPNNQSKEDMDTTEKAEASLPTVDPKADPKDPDVLEKADPIHSAVGPEDEPPVKDLLCEPDEGKKPAKKKKKKRKKNKNRQRTLTESDTSLSGSESTQDKPELIKPTEEAMAEDPSPPPKPPAKVVETPPKPIETPKPKPQKPAKPAPAAPAKPNLPKPDVPVKEVPVKLVPEKEPTEPTPPAGPEGDEVEEVESGWHRAESKKDRKKRAKRAHKLDAASAATRSNTKLGDLLDQNGRTRLPPKWDPKTGESDDEDWLEDDSHPIDWYVRELESILASPTILTSSEIKFKLQYAWNFYVPGDPCPFIRCQRPAKGKKVVKCSTRARFARHVMENHMTAQLKIYCIAGEPGTANACRAWTDGNFHRSLRRGEHVRHLMKNGMHQLTAPRARELVNNCWASKVGTTCVGKLQKRLVKSNASMQFNLASDEWSRCLGKQVGYKTQTEIGNENTEVSPTEPETKGLKRARALQRAQGTPGEDPPGGTKRRKLPETVVSSVRKSKLPKVPAAGSRAPTLSKVKTRQLGQLTTLANESLGAEAAAKLTKAFIEQHTPKPPPTQAVTKDVEAPPSLSRSGTDWTAAVKGTLPVIPDIGVVDMEDQQEEDTDSNVLVSVNLPGPSEEFRAIATPAAQDLRDAMSLEFSRVMDSQIAAFESAVVTASGLIGVDMKCRNLQEGQAMRDDLELQRQEMFRDAQYYQDRYTEITGRLERLSTHLYRQFGVSVESWERSGYPRLTPRTPTLTMRPTGSTAGGGGLLFGAPARGSDTPTTDMLSSGMASLGTISTPRSAPRYAFGGPAYAAGSASMSGLFQPTFGPVATVRRSDEPGKGRDPEDSDSDTGLL